MTPKCDQSSCTFSHDQRVPEAQLNTKQRCRFQTKSYAFFKYNTCIYIYVYFYPPGIASHEYMYSGKENLKSA